MSLLRCCLHLLKAAHFDSDGEDDHKFSMRTSQVGLERGARNSTEAVALCVRELMQRSG